MGAPVVEGGGHVALVARPAPVRLRVLRGFELRVGPGLRRVPGPVERLLAFLAVHDRPHHRRTVAAQLWTDVSDDRAAANLRAALWRGRKVLGEHLVTDGGYVALDAAVDVDLRRLIGQAHRLLHPDHPLDDADAAPDAMLGDLLPDWDEEWIVFERERVRQLRVHALEALSRKLLSVDRTAEAVDVAMAAVSAEPLRESAQRHLVTAHLAEGNVSEAHRQYLLYRDVLWDALAIEPSSSFRRLIALGDASAPT